MQAQTKDTRKENYRSLSLINIDTKILNKNASKQSPAELKKKLYTLTMWDLSQEGLTYTPKSINVIPLSVE